MSSYRGTWDGGPPGAEAEPGPPPAPPARALPSTDPWTGVSYTHYAPPGFDYQAYGNSYGYNYDPNYYSRPDAGYYGKYPEPRTYPQGSYSSYPSSSNDRHTPEDSKSYDRKRNYKSKSRSISPYDKRDKKYSRNRDSSNESSSRRLRSRSKSKRSKYSSSDRSSSRSRSLSRSPAKKDKSKRSASTDSSDSVRSYNNKPGRNHGLESPAGRTRSSSISRSRSRSASPDRHSSRSPRKNNRKSVIPTSHSKRDTYKRHKRDAQTPPRKHSQGTPPRAHKSDRSSITPPKSFKKTGDSNAPSKNYKYKDRSPGTPPRKKRDTSLTPPKCYARSRSSSSKSRSRSRTPSISKRRKTGHSDRSRSRSESYSSSSKSSRSSEPRHKSHSKSQRKSKTRKRTRDRHSHSSRDSKSRSRSKSSASHSHSQTPSDDERRGQFTVADRKRFWKLHKSRQVEREKDKTPPKEVKPPPGAVESTKIDDIEYGDPPEVEGPNFAELLPPVDQLPGPSNKKPLPIPIKNDGSFLEMFKKMQEATQKVDEKPPEIKRPALPFIGKRRGGRVLKTGLVKKAKAIDEQTVDNTPKDAWSLYMQEVKKYRETSCEEERKTRPLVK